jgi:hypothetical protein
MKSNGVSVANDRKERTIECTFCYDLVVRDQASLLLPLLANLCLYAKFFGEKNTCKSEPNFRSTGVANFCGPSCETLPQKRRATVSGNFSVSICREKTFDGSQ